VEKITKRGDSEERGGEGRGICGRFVLKYGM